MLAPHSVLGILCERLSFKFCGLRLLPGPNILLMSYSQHWYPDHWTQWGGILDARRASLDTQIFLGDTQYPWGKAGPAALLVRAPGTLARTLAKALALSGPCKVSFTNVYYQHNFPLLLRGGKGTGSCVFINQDLLPLGY